MVLLTGFVNVSSHTKCVSLNNQQFQIQLTFTNSHPSMYSQELNCFPFVLNLDRCVKSCNTLNDLIEYAF